MNQLMDIGAVIQGYVLGATVRTTYMMMLELMFTIIPQERKHLKETVGHEPTNENWGDDCQFLGERASNPKCLQRAEDREKFRRLVFGDGNTEGG